MSNQFATNVNQAKISIIIPTLNEAGNIDTTLKSVLGGENIEIIVVDGGSDDKTLEIVQQFPVQAMVSAPGRATQMNRGTEVAKGDIFLFLHADTQLPPGYDTMVRNALAIKGTVAGAFALQIDAPQYSLRLIEWGVKMRSQFFQFPYGDQAIFLTRDIFFQVGMFPTVPIMEDFILVRTLQRLGKITLIPVPVVTSARRWLSRGILKTTLINQMIIFGYFLGVSPQILHRLYQRRK
ncbi:TIGR04283 family arsenosugar biosynthesis glycosyltransferase [Calothrix sp. NIES-3974]|uniref:TIGR04283 family arsenosugar biosynthesis glycosyltransferase n=1 Tax=Calothrix sp. NIES-3974 TaxID=2005462 RepID=UPI000B5E1A5C|nr:TIGR04283 family arsenosugar biosynthesis glycosyltransferase [Calothrix sp. NIES-3974]BAZ07898.1 glycosyl transferase family protein [Calothrix sp. NIES-3974]